MSDRYLSIKDFATAAGVSVQSVYKRLNQVDNSLNQYSTQVDGKKMLNIQALQDIYGIEVEQPVEQPLNLNIKPDLTGENDIYKALLQQLDILQEQLQVKDQQISDLNSRLQDSLNLLDQQQKLTAVAEQKILQLEQRDQDPEAPEPENPPVKSWWRRIFFS